MLIDTHCHLDCFPDPMSLAADCEAQKITTIAVTNIPSHYSNAVQLIGQRRHVKPSLGLHPMAVNDNLKELQLFIALVEEVQFVGEIGLDFSKKGMESREVQISTFREIAKALSSGKRFVTLHSLCAEEEVLGILQEFGIEKCVFHWFSGTATALGKIIAAGHYFSINTEMIESQNGLEVLRQAPRDRILTESDGPYVKIGKKDASPLDMKQVIAGIATAWGWSANETETLVCDNYLKLCGSLGITHS